MTHPRTSMAPQRIGVGVIGLGRIAQAKYLPFLHSVGRIRCICDSSPRTLQIVGDNLGTPSAERYASVSDLVDACMGGDSLDAVFVLSDDHYEVLMELAKLAIPIFVEKPLVWTLSELSNIRRDCPSGLLFPGFMRRFDPVVAQLSHNLSTIGEVTRVSIRNYTGGLHRHMNPIYREIPTHFAPGNSLSNRIAEEYFFCPEQTEIYKNLVGLASHDIDLLTLLFLESPLLSHRLILLSHQHNLAQFALGEVHCTMETLVDFDTMRDWDHEWTVHGTRGSHHLRFSSPFLPNTGAALVTRWLANGDYLEQTHEATGGDGFERQMQAFFDGLGRPDTRSENCSSLTNFERLLVFFRDLVSKAEIPERR